MPISASKLRENVYTILDEVLETGIPVEVLRKGRSIKIVPDQKPSKLRRLKKRAYPLDDPESLVHMDWLHEWSEMK